LIDPLLIIVLPIALLLCLSPWIYTKLIAQPKQGESPS